MADTLPRKRDAKGGHVFVCLACDGLAMSTRAHALTCSPACRSWLRRHPRRLQELTITCALTHITPALVQAVTAVRRLRPDLFERIRAGEIEIDDARADVYEAMLELLRLREAS